MKTVILFQVRFGMLNSSSLIKMIIHRRFTRTQRLVFSWNLNSEIGSFLSEIFENKLKLHAMEESISKGDSLPEKSFMNNPSNGYIKIVDPDDQDSDSMRYFLMSLRRKLKLIMALRAPSI